jgi:iron complex transport system substrate-binding protein
MKRFKKTPVLALLAISSLLMLFGCNADSPSTTTTPDYQTVIDMDGDELQMPAKIETIIDTWSAATDNLFNLGAGDLLVSGHSAANSKWARRVYPPIADLPDYSKATTEEMLRVDADMVLVTSKARKEELRAAGVNAVNLVYKDYETFKQSTILMGKMLGDVYEERANKVAEYVDYVMTESDKLLAQLPESERPVVYYCMSNDPTNLYASAGGGSIIDEWVIRAGGKLATADLGKGMGLKDVTAEQILKTNPDVIMIDGDNAAELAANFKNTPEWKDIEAVKNNRIYAIPAGCFWWGRMCGDTPLQVLWAASTLHPDKIDVDMRAETRHYYKEFKMCELTDAEIEEILRYDLLG